MQDQPYYNEQINNIDPVSGRECLFTQALGPYLSEAALHRYRAFVEIENLIALSEKMPEKYKPTITQEQKDTLRSFATTEFEPKVIAALDHFSFNSIGPLEHDVKAVEVYLGIMCDKHDLSHLKEFIHFPATSEDINNLAYGLMLQDSLQHVIIPKAYEIAEALKALTLEHKSTAVIGRTHGQIATPTTVGKRFAYFLDKIAVSIHALTQWIPEGKFSGPVGSHNAMHLLFPDWDIQDYSCSFVESLGFIHVDIENQRNSHGSIVQMLNEVRLMNEYIADLCEHVRHGVMMGQLFLTATETHVGSSVMPHKVNPWFFEVGEGYFEIANCLIAGSQAGLIRSVFERDLTDHPWERSYGSMFGNTLTGLSYVSNGLKLVKVDKRDCEDSVYNHPVVLSEAIQLAGRVTGSKDTYMTIKKLVRGQDTDHATMRKIIESLPPSLLQDRLEDALDDRDIQYTGLAPEQCDGAVSALCDVELPTTTVLFDLDGTLQTGDKEELAARLQAICAKMEIPVSISDINHCKTLSCWREMKTYIQGAWSGSAGIPGLTAFTEDDFEAQNKKISGTLDHHFKPMVNALSTLRFLKANGFKTGIVTTRGSKSALRLIESHGFEDLIDVVVTRDDCKERKPSPEPINQALKLLGVTSNTAIYVGDIDDDIRAANAAGCSSVLIGEIEINVFDTQTPNDATPHHHIHTNMSQTLWRITKIVQMGRFE